MSVITVVVHSEMLASTLKYMLRFETQLALLGIF